MKERAIMIISNRMTSLVMIGFIISLVFCYIYFANKAVRTITLMEKAKEEFQFLSVEVSEMESKRFIVENKINETLAKSLGLFEINDKTFILDKDLPSISFKTE